MGMKDSRSSGACEARMPSSSGQIGSDGSVNSHHHEVAADGDSSVPPNHIPLLFHHLARYLFLPAWELCSSEQTSFDFRVGIKLKLRGRK